MHSRKNNKYILISVFTTTLIIAYIEQAAGYNISWIVQIGIATAWIAIFCFALEYNKKSNTTATLKREQLKFFMKLFLLPLIVPHLYSILLNFFGKVNTYRITTNVTVYIPTIFAILAFNFLGATTIKCHIKALFWAWFISFLTALIFIGPQIVPNALREAYFDDITAGKNYLEFHDIGLSIGYFIVFYTWITNFRSTSKWNFYVLLGSWIIFFFSMKRVSFIAIFAEVILVFWLKRMKNDKGRYRFCLILGIITVFVGYFFIFFFMQASSYTSLLSLVDLRGRNYYYQAALSLAKFNPLFFGIGRNALTQIFQTEWSYMRVDNVHSDLIKLFVEYGFVLYGLWLIFFYIIAPHMIKNRYGEKGAIVYYILQFYKFFMFMTDNTETYFIAQISIIIFTVYYCIYRCNKESCITI